MLLAGVILLLVAAAAAIPVFDQGALESLTENSTCNGRPCTEDEVKTIATAISLGSGIIGIVLVLLGVGRAVRGRSETPDISETLGSVGDEYGERMEALSKLDEAYGRGEVDEGSYRRRKRELSG